jgi:voltage-gated potassium channel
MKVQLREDRSQISHSRQAAFERFSRAVDGPLMLLALLMIPLLIVPLVVPLHGSTNAIVVALDYFVWAVFAIEYAIKFYLAPDRRQFVRRNIPDLVIVIVPMLRSLRILRSARLLRLLRLSRLAAFTVEGLGEVL